MVKDDHKNLVFFFFFILYKAQQALDSIRQHYTIIILQHPKHIINRICPNPTNKHIIKSMKYRFQVYIISYGTYHFKDKTK